MIKKPSLRIVTTIHICGEHGTVLEEIKEDNGLGENVDILLTALDLFIKNPAAQHIFFYGERANESETVNRADLPELFGFPKPAKAIEVAEINNEFLHSLVDDTDFDELTLPQVRKLLTFVGEAYMRAFLKK